MTLPGSGARSALTIGSLLPTYLDGLLTSQAVVTLSPVHCNRLKASPQVAPDQREGPTCQKPLGPRRQRQQLSPTTNSDSSEPGSLSSGFVVFGWNR